MGTQAWVNWREFLIGGHEIENFEDELHSDRNFGRNGVSLGPYRLYSAQRKRDGITGTAIIVENQQIANLMPQIVVDGELAPQNTSGYHGGTIGDELAALISLELGVRVRFAGTRRMSGIHRPDSHYPPMYMEVSPVHDPIRSGREMIPRVVRRPTDLGTLSAVKLFPHITEAKQLSLVRAARSYANGLWAANDDPNLAWLQLVTAVEAAAVEAAERESAATETDDLDVLREYDPELWRAIEPAADGVRRDVARLRVPKMSVTRKFTEFITNRAEPPPEDERPQTDRLDWSRLQRTIKDVYGLRSAALHQGHPFPMPMLNEPITTAGCALQETPSGLSAGGQGGIWRANGTPMLLSTFEQIARSALLSWWKEG